MFSKQSYPWGTFLVLIFLKMEDWKKVFHWKSFNPFTADLHTASWGRARVPNSQAKLLRSKHLTACTAEAVLTLTPSSVLNHTCTRQPCAQERLRSWTTSSWELTSPRLCPPSKAPGQVHTPQGEALLLIPITLHLSSSWVSPGVCGWPRQQGRTLSTTEDSAGAGTAHPSVPSPETAAVACLSQAGQKSPAAPATARVAWWPVRDSKAKIQPLQLLWLSHLLNYVRKCARNHNLHWFSSPLPETRVNCARGNHS